MGVVYHANYLVWMELGRTEYGKPDGFVYSELEREGIVMTVVEANVRYLNAARYDEEVTVRTRIAESNARRVVFHYELVVVEGEGKERRVATGETKHLFCALSSDKRELKLTKLPEKWRWFFEA